MSLKDIKGNEQLIQRLTKAIKNQHVSHAYLFEGDSLLDKKAFADEFVKGILCEAEPGIGCDRCATCNKIKHGNYEDLIYVEADGRSLKDAAIVALQNRLKTKPFGERNIAVISDADTMTLRAQNRLLKTLEEPPQGTIIILLSENIENLTQTILSRCVKYRLNYFEQETYAGMNETACDVADMLLQGTPFYKINARISDIIKDDKKSNAFLDAMEKRYRDLLLSTEAKSRLYKKSQIFEYVDAIEAARRQLQQGVAKSYAIKNLMIKIGG